MTLRRDPDAIRAWQQRSAETAARRRRERNLRLVESGAKVTSLAPVSKQRRERDAAEGRRPRRSTLRHTTTGLVASLAQRAKVDGMPSIVSGRGPCDPAHLWPQSRGGCGDPDCVVPLTREEHEAFDRGELDLLPHLVHHGCWRELAHMVLVHEVDPLSMLHRLTGEQHEPESTVLRRAQRLAERLVEEMPPRTPPTGGEAA